MRPAQDVVEWLIEEGHEEQEISRVSLAGGVANTAAADASRRVGLGWGYASTCSSGVGIRWDPRGVPQQLCVRLYRDFVRAAADATCRRFVVDWVNARGATPLHIAAMKGEVESVQVGRLHHSFRP